jgi:prepilin-type processing-associated H-X9-DG protein
MGHYFERLHSGNSKELILLAPIAESEVVNPNDMMAIGDNYEGYDALISQSWVTKSKKCEIPSRHHGRDNVLFCDGHVESPT